MSDHLLSRERAGDRHGWLIGANRRILYGAVGTHRGGGQHSSGMRGCGTVVHDWGSEFVDVCGAASEDDGQTAPIPRGLLGRARNTASVTSRLLCVGWWSAYGLLGVLRRGRSGRPTPSLRSRGRPRRTSAPMPCERRRAHFEGDRSLLSFFLLAPDAADCRAIALGQSSSRWRLPRKARSTSSADRPLVVNFCQDFGRPGVPQIAQIS